MTNILIYCYFCYKILLMLLFKPIVHVKNRYKNGIIQKININYSYNQ
jgi:hypothetical protein